MSRTNARLALVVSWIGGLLVIGIALVIAGCATDDPQLRHFWLWVGGPILGVGAAAMTIVSLRAGLHKRLFCTVRNFHDWISQHERDEPGRMRPLEEIKCRTCGVERDWLEHLEEIKKIPRQEWMDPECSLCDHTNVIQELAKSRRWRPQMTADVLMASFCQRCPKYQARMPREAVITDEERPEPGVRQVRCPQCNRAFMAVGGTPGEEVPLDEVPLCRRCHEGLPSEMCRVIRFRRRE